MATLEIHVGVSDAGSPHVELRPVAPVLEPGDNELRVRLRGREVDVATLTKFNPPKASPETCCLIRGHEPKTIHFAEGPPKVEDIIYDLRLMLADGTTLEVINSAKALSVTAGLRADGARGAARRGEVESKTM